MAAPADMDTEQIFGMVEMEIEYRWEMFHKLNQTCFNKCVDKKYKESELSMRENTCVDRCMAKYMQVTNLVGQTLGTETPCDFTANGGFSIFSLNESSAQNAAKQITCSIID